MVHLYPGKLWGRCWLVSKCSHRGLLLDKYTSFLDGGNQGANPVTLLLKPVLTGSVTVVADVRDDVSEGCSNAADLISLRALWSDISLWSWQPLGRNTIQH